jgi:hypothetical protein
VENRPPHRSINPAWAGRAAQGLAIVLMLMSGCHAEEEDDSLDKSTGDSGASDLSAEWHIEGLSLARDDFNHAEVSGTVTLERLGPGTGSWAEVRYYEDEYLTLIEQAGEFIGDDLREEGRAQVFRIIHYKAYLEPSNNGYERICAEFRADGSNYLTWTPLGCL